LAELLRLDGEAQVESTHWGFAGTRVLTGQVSLRVVYTGGETLYGEIVRSAIRGAHERTPLQRAVADLVKILVGGAALVCVFLAWVRFHQGHGLLDALISALTLAVAALPEEFPVVMTFFLGVGVYRLARRQALVRRGVVVENIGRVSCICTDKTGTLTEGRLRLAHRYPSKDVDESRLLLITAAASRKESADPMDLAILQTCLEADGIDRVACFPFTEDRKRETAVFREGGDLLAAVKGAPETVLAMCSLLTTESEHWQTLTRELAESAHKVIACAWRRLDGSEWPGGEPDRGYRFAGLLAFEDPVRSGVSRAIGICRDAHIHVIMVTGDHPATAAAVAREIGLGDGSPVVIPGDEMERRIASEGGAFLSRVNVIARAVPAQKLGLVRILQGQGEIVAVTGDGVNDVPALQAADIGIAMGERGTRSAREVAAIVLLDDNFRSIVWAIAEGRQLFRNLQLSFAYLLMIHLPLVATAAMIPLAGYPLLYLPVHVVWLELIIHPTALLVFQNLPAGETLAPLPRSRELRFFGRAQWLVIILTGAVVATVVMFSYDRSLGAGYDVAHARAMAMVALTVASAGITAALSRLRGLAAKVMVAATIGLSLILVQVPVLAHYLNLHPLHLDDWLIAMGGGLLAAVLPALIPTSHGYAPK
jgi:Ca2+-transporting ATPase